MIKYKTESKRPLFLIVSSDKTFDYFKIVSHFINDKFY